MLDECEGCGDILTPEDSDTYPYCHRCDEDAELNVEELYERIEKEHSGEME